MVLHHPPAASPLPPHPPAHLALLPVVLKLGHQALEHGGAAAQLRLGVGADCVDLVGAVFEDADVVPFGRAGMRYVVRERLRTWQAGWLWGSCPGETLLVGPARPLPARARTHTHTHTHTHTTRL